jgi:hypothetical protein
MMNSLSDKLGLASIPVLATMAAAFGLFGLEAGLIFQSVLLETMLSIGMLLSVSLVVARISVKSFLLTGSSNVLLLGLAVFEFGLDGMVGGFVSGINVTRGVAVYIAGVFASACLHLTSGVLTYRGSPRRTTLLRLRVGISYIATILFVVTISVLAVETSFLSSLGQSGTLVEQSMLGAIVVMLLLSAFFFWRVYSRSHNRILYWYSLGLATNSSAFVLFFLSRNNGDLATWTGIGGICLGSIYFLFSVLAAPKIFDTNRTPKPIR